MGHEDATSPLLHGVIRGLISYPYYTKNHDPTRDHTEFRHLDINLASAVHEGRGLNMIQGYASLTDETDLNSTMVVKGMHQHAEEWLQRMESRGKMLKQNVIDLRDENLFTTKGPDNNAEHFETNWSSVPCMKGEVRISSPLLPHGAQASNMSQAIRQTVLP